MWLYPFVFTSTEEGGMAAFYNYSAGADRVAASLGGGGLKAVGSNPGMQERADWLFWESHERVNGRMLQENDHKCIWQSSLPTGEYCEPIDGIPGRMKASVEFYLNDLYYNLKVLAEEQHDEKDVYFYHSDHLGSASWITDADGKPIQHLQYLPFGEPFVNQHLTDYQERYLFTGKERDEETGYGYFGARYMDHELTAMWLSVDPMADKYPSISPYAYCAWNPVRLVDPDGNDWYQNELTGAIYYNSNYRGESMAGTGAMKGDGWKYLGANGMFSTDAAHNSDLDIVRRNNGKMNFNTGTNGFDLELSLNGDMAKSVMKSVGYKQVPTQVIQYDNTYEMRMPGSPNKNIDFDCGSRIDYVEKVGYVPNSYKEINRSNIGKTVYGKFDPILNNMPFANRQQIRYGEKSGFLGFLETLVQSILPAHHDLSSSQRISIKDYKKDNKLVNTILKRK